ncbi:conserved hypothetical protein [Vibrio crassostreae]|nr:conserved hypothetical protein [Vibrio crassostreae]
MISKLTKPKLSKSNDYKKLKALLYALDITNEETVNKIFQIRQHLIEVDKKTLSTFEYDMLVNRLRATSSYKTTLSKLLVDIGLAVVINRVSITFNEILFNIEEINVVFSNEYLIVKSGNRQIKRKVGFERYLSFMLNIDVNTTRKVSVDRTLLVLEEFEYCNKNTTMTIGKSKSFSTISNELGFERSFVKQRLVRLRNLGYLNELKSEFGNRKVFGIKKGFLNCTELSNKKIQHREFTLYVTKNGTTKIKLENEEEIYIND